MPLRPGVEGQSPSYAPAAAVVAAGPTPARLRMEQAVQHHLSRIDEWERPELNRTLAEALCSLKVQERNEVFEMAWRLHRTRNKALENPAGWWASTLKRTAEACRKAYRQPVQLE